MGARDWHLARAQRNKEASDAFEKDYPEWAVTALFYSALHYVHSSLADEDALAKDERHPRKHSSINQGGGRGTNQLVSALYPEINLQYRSLVELAHKSRYDVLNLDAHTVPLLRVQWKSIKDFCEAINMTRERVPTQRP